MCNGVNKEQVILAVVTVFCVVVEVGLIQRDLQIYEEIKPFVSPRALDECFKPQIVMRIVFSFYGINISLALLVIVLA